MPFEPVSWYAWDDLRTPATGINPPGAASDPTRSTTTGLLHFSGSADNVLVGTHQMPHRWANGTEIRPHIHLRFPTAASGKNSRWKLEYDVANINGEFTNNYGTLTDGGTITVANPNNAKKHVMALFAPIDMTGFVDSCQIVWKLTRLADTDVLDDDTGEAVLLEVDFHYQSNGHGSSEPAPGSADEKGVL